MIYGDDQCVHCGGIRVARSTLCADCLVKYSARRTHGNIEKDKEIKELEGKLDKSIEMIERLLDHIARESIHSGDLWWQLQECIKKEQRGG